MLRLKTPAINLPLAVTMLSWALNFSVLKLLYLEVHPPAVGLVRFAGMYIALYAICRFQGYPLGYRREDAFKIILLGFVSMGFYMILFFEGMLRTSANEGAIILASTPILTSLMAVAFKQERFSRGALAGAALGFAGVATVISSGSNGNGALKGNLIILSSSILWAYSAVLMRSLLGKYQPVQLLTMAMPGALIALLPYGLRETLTTHWTQISPLAWLFIAHLAVFSGAIGFAGFYAGVRKVGAGSAMLYQYFVPPCTALFSWLLLGQVMRPLQWLGMAVVIAGVSVSMHFRKAVLIPTSSGVDPSLSEPEPVSGRR